MTTPFTKLTIVARGDSEMRVLADALEFAAKALREGAPVCRSASFTEAALLAIEIKSTGGKGGDASHGGESTLILSAGSGAFLSSAQ